MDGSEHGQGPNTTLVADGVEAMVRGLEARLVGEIDVAGPKLAQSLYELGLLDEYRLYLRPLVLGQGTPFFAGSQPPLRFLASDLIGDDVIRMTYAVARDASMYRAEAT